MAASKTTQQDRAIGLLRKRGMLRTSELASFGVSSATIARMRARGLVRQLRRGLYCISGATHDGNHGLAEIAKIAPRAVVCLISALAVHELTTMMPSHLWIAIGRKDRKPHVAYPPIRVVRFDPGRLTSGTERHIIDGVAVRITDPARTVVDLFRCRTRTGLNVAIEGLREALRQRKATPAEIASEARKVNAWKIVQPYLEAMTSRV
jgi:predicted transcriptional regulator of viral defense system